MFGWVFRILEVFGFVWWAKTDRSWGFKQQRADLQQLQQELATGRFELEDMQRGLKAIEVEFVKTKLPPGDAGIIDQRIADMNLALDQWATKYPHNFVVQRATEKARLFYEKQIRRQA